MHTRYHSIILKSLKDILPGAHVSVALMMESKAAAAAWVNHFPSEQLFAIATRADDLDIVNQALRTSS